MIVELVRFGMIGAGFIGEHFAEAAAAVDGVELVAVCSRNRVRAEAFAAKHRVPVVAGDVSPLAVDPTVDAVYVASPNSLHEQHTLEMLKAGKHVLVEKPMALSAAQVARMADAARRTDRLLVEAYRTAFEPGLERIRDLVGSLPQVRRAVFIKDQYSSRFDAYKEGDVRPAFDPRFGGGSVMDLGFYPVSLGIHLFGPPRRVTATAQLLSSGVDAQGTIVLDYAGFEAVCMHSKVATCGIPSEVAGERSAVVFDDCAAPANIRIVTGSHRPTNTGADRDSARRAALDPLRAGSFLSYEVAAFAQLVRDGERESSRHPLANSLATARVLDEARRQTGVRFPRESSPETAT